MSSRGLLLTVGLLALFFAVFIPLAFYVKGGTNTQIDAERMRRTFVALTLYEGSNDGLPAPTLASVARDLDPTDLQSVADPEAERSNAHTVVTRAVHYSYDALVPTPKASPVRVSWTYRWSWKGAGDPRAVERDPRRGLLVDPWLSPMLRMVVDGSIRTVPKTDKAGFGDLFGQ